MFLHYFLTKWDLISYQHLNGKLSFMTPTAGHQFDVPSVHESYLVVGLAAHCDLLRLVEGHLAPHLAGFTSLAVGDVGQDAQHPGLRYQWMPNCCLVAEPAAGHGRQRKDSKEVKADSQNFTVKLFFCEWSAISCLLRVQRRMGDLLVHAVTAVPLDGRGWDPLGHTGHQMFFPREVVVSKVFNPRGNYTLGGVMVINHEKY